MVKGLIHVKKGIVVVSGWGKQGRELAVLEPKKWKEVCDMVRNIYVEFNSKYQGHNLFLLPCKNDPNVFYFHIDSQRISTVLIHTHRTPTWVNTDKVQTFFEEVEKTVTFLKEVKKAEDYLQSDGNHFSTKHRTKVLLVSREKKIEELERKVKDLEEKLASLTVIVTNHPALKPPPIKK